MGRSNSPDRELNTAEFVEFFAGLPMGSTSEQIRVEADEIFGEDRVGDD